jgi:hypothetical protein
VLVANYNPEFEKGECGVTGSVAAFKRNPDGRCEDSDVQPPHPHQKAEPYTTPHTTPHTPLTAHTSDTSLSFTPLSVFFSLHFILRPSPFTLRRGSIADEDRGLVRFPSPSHQMVFPRWDTENHARQNCPHAHMVLMSRDQKTVRLCEGVQDGCTKEKEQGKGTICVCRRGTRRVYQGKVTSNGRTAAAQGNMGKGTV